MNEIEKERIVKSFVIIIDDALFGLRKIDAITNKDRETIENKLRHIIKSKGD